MKNYISVSTDFYETSVANEDVLARLILDNGLSTGSVAKKTEIYTKGDLLLEINGRQKALLAGSELQIDNEGVFSFKTVTLGVEFYVTFEF